MRTWLVAIVLLAACKGKDKGADTPKPEAKAAGPSAPTVKIATVLAKDEAKPPFILLVDDAGMVKLAAAATWADVDANKLTISKSLNTANEVDKYVREMYAMGRVSPDAITRWDESVTIDLATLDDTKSNNAAKDDPPPPEPEDGADESGGTGTAMALEEGKMGKKDSDRAEGQYKMQKNTEDPQLARQQAIEQARAAGILAPAKGGPAAELRGLANEDGMPSRAADVTGVVMKDGKIDRLRAMIVIAPTAKASTLIDVVRETEAAIAVSVDGKVRPLHLQFSMRDFQGVPGPSSRWLEARVSNKGITVEAVPDAPIDVTAVDQLGAAIDKARATRGIDVPVPVDILVDPDVNAQRLVDIIVALDLAKVETIGLGKALPADQLALRGHRIPATRIGQPNAQGDLDKNEIRRVVKTATKRITACYEKALVVNSSLSGTVQVQFFIKPDGKVASAAANGVSPEVADCVATVVKALVFPKPKGGGGVQVNYPFTMRN